MTRSKKTVFLFFLLTGCFIISTCERKFEKVMNVSTGTSTDITSNSATVSGQIIDLGEGATQYGHYYGKTTGVKNTGIKTTNGVPKGTVSFTSKLNNLDAGIKYYYQAYLTDGKEIVYGSEISFSTIPSSTVPGAPTIGIATAGNAQATVTFTAPSSNGGSNITGYTVTSSPGGFIATGSESPITVTGLTNGTAYIFTVTATNASGTGPASSASNSVTPSPTSTVPGAPTIGTATAGNAQATVTFTAPGSNGGSVITGYTVTSSSGGFTATGSVSPITVTGLTNGTAYTFTVTATNANGTGPASSASNPVTPSPTSTVPGAPTIGTATAGNAQATITFTAPGSNGGSIITGYTLTSSPGGFTATGSASPITVTGLTNGTAYTFTVTATNANGTGPASSASNSVTLPLTDEDGNVYNTVTIGTQVWMKENLKTTKYNNGDLIGTTTPINKDISIENTPKYQWPCGNNESNVTTYGRLYTWYAVTDSRNICPAGWHLPTDAEWSTLTDYLTNNGYGYGGSGSTIAKSMAATAGWQTSGNAGDVGNDQASNNSSHFNALPSGFHEITGGVGQFITNCYWWSSTGYDTRNNWTLEISYNRALVDRNWYSNQSGLSVRCIRD
jgi:uncharacterized protein (TIGR02145 family)